MGSSLTSAHLLLRLLDDVERDVREPVLSPRVPRRLVRLEQPPLLLRRQAGWVEFKGVRRS